MKTITLLLLTLFLVNAFSLTITHQKYWRCPAMDDWVGNDNGRLVKGKDFSSTCRDISFGKQREGALRIGAICRTRNGG